MNTKYLPRLAITAGEPAGIGPDLVVQIAQEKFAAELVVVCDPDLLTSRANSLGLPLKIEPFDRGLPPSLNMPASLKILAVDLPAPVQTGRLNPDHASYVTETLKVACQGCLDRTFAGMVTAPVHKAIINQAGIPFTGHTEFLAEICGNSHPVMMLANDKVRVALVTTHLPLAKVPQAITQDLLEQTIRIVHHDLKQRFGLDHPRISVCGLNPHAGEDGHLGHEEQTVIQPVLERLRREGLYLLGPVPADTAFTADSLEQCDVIISMFHDQGLPPLKALGFGETVNITLGLPIIRTSVDHGTALHLAGSGTARDDSLAAAIQCAIQMANYKNINQTTSSEQSPFPSCANQ